MSNNSENENDSFDSLPDINMTTYEITFPRRRRNSDIPNSNSASSTSLASEMAAPNPNQKPNPKMRTGPTLGPRKAAKVSDIF
jgi:hypothetical protein